MEKRDIAAVGKASSMPPPTRNSWVASFFKRRPSAAALSDSGRPAKHRAVVHSVPSHGSQREAPIVIDDAEPEIETAAEQQGVEVQPQPPLCTTSGGRSEVSTPETTLKRKWIGRGKRVAQHARDSSRACAGGGAKGRAGKAETFGKFGALITEHPSPQSACSATNAASLSWWGRSYSVAYRNALRDRRPPGVGVHGTEWGKRAGLGLAGFRTFQFGGGGRPVLPIPTAGPGRAPKVDGRYLANMVVMLEAVWRSAAVPFPAADAQQLRAVAALLPAHRPAAELLATLHHAAYARADDRARCRWFVCGEQERGAAEQLVKAGLARALLAAEDVACGEEALLLAALTEPQLRDLLRDLQPATRLPTSRPALEAAVVAVAALPAPASTPSNPAPRSPPLKPSAANLQPSAAPFRGREGQGGRLRARLAGVLRGNPQQHVTICLDDKVARALYRLQLAFFAANGVEPEGAAALLLCDLSTLLPHQPPTPTPHQEKTPEPQEQESEEGAELERLAWAVEQSDRLEEGVRRGDAATVYAAVEAAAQRLTRSDLPPNSDAGISVACGSRREIEASGGGERASAMAMIQGEEVRALWRVVWVGVGLFERDRRYRQALHYIDLLLRHGPAPRRSARTPSLPRVIAAPESDVVCVDVEETSGREEEERLWSAGDEVAPAGWGGGGWGYWRGALQWRKVVDMGYAGSTRAALAACEAALAEHSLLQGEWRIHLEDRATRLSAPPLRWRAPSFPRRTAPPRTVLAPPAAHRWGPGPEAAALDWYRSEAGGGWEGAHLENGVWLSLFGILFADFLLQPECGLQLGDAHSGRESAGLGLREAPVELYNGGFLRRHSTAIEHRLAAMAALPPPRLHACTPASARKQPLVQAVAVAEGGVEQEVQEGEGEEEEEEAAEEAAEVVGEELVAGLLEGHWHRFAGRACLGVDWARHSLAELQTLAAHVGGRVLSHVCCLLAKDHRLWRHGLPDLLLWGSAAPVPPPPPPPPPPPLPPGSDLPRQALSTEDAEEEEPAGEERGGEAAPLRAAHVPAHVPAPAAEQADTRPKCGVCGEAGHSRAKCPAPQPPAATEAERATPCRLGASVARRAMLVEVKGKGDSLSAAQRAWIHELLGAGARVEVCHLRRQPAA